MMCNIRCILLSRAKSSPDISSVETQKQKADAATAVLQAFLGQIRDLKKPQNPQPATNGHVQVELTVAKQSSRSCPSSVYGMSRVRLLSHLNGRNENFTHIQAGERRVSSSTEHGSRPVV